jgi:hypothetical protein
VWVGDDAAARDAAQTALDIAIDPNRPVRVRLATATRVQLAATIVIDPRYLPAPVMAAVQTALIDPAIGLFGPARTGIGTSIYDSQIYAACLAVDGVRAVRDLVVTTPPCIGTTLSPTALPAAAILLERVFLPPIRLPGLHPGTGIVLPPIPGVDATLCTGAHRHDPCAGGFFTLAAPDLQLTNIADDGTRPDG